MMMVKPRFLILRSDENTMISEPPLKPVAFFTQITGTPACYTQRMFYLLTKRFLSSLPLSFWIVNILVTAANTYALYGIFQVKCISSRAYSCHDYSHGLWFHALQWCNDDGKNSFLDSEV
jgi:hypothetical protein